MGAAMGASTAATLADDGERCASSWAWRAPKRWTPGLITGVAAEPSGAWAPPLERFFYLDAANAPQGPISRAPPEELFRAGMLKTGVTAWVRYGALDS